MIFRGQFVFELSKTKHTIRIQCYLGVFISSYTQIIHVALFALFIPFIANSKKDENTPVKGGNVADLGLYILTSMYVFIHH